MEVVTIQSEVFKKMQEQLELITDYITTKEKQINKEGDEKIWLYTKEAAHVLRISEKTLQRLRREGLISYSMLRGRCLYCLAELERVLKEHIVSADPEAINEYRKNYYMKNRSYP